MQQATDIKQAFNAFKQNPSAANAWKLQQAMVAYAEYMATEKAKIEPQALPNLKTKKGGKWDEKLKEILELFSAFDWEVIPHKTNKYVESWKVTDADLNQAILFLTSNGFSLGSEKPNTLLTGGFEGYDEEDRFQDFLVSNGIEIDE